MRLEKSRAARRVLLGIILSLFILPAAGAQADSPTNSQNSVSASWVRKHVIVNPVTADWIKKHLKKHAPRIILSKSIEQKIKAGIKRNPVIHAYFRYLHQSANAILTQPLLSKVKNTRHAMPTVTLVVSREAVRRMSTLAFVYRFTHDEKYLHRLSREIDLVSSYSSWGPSNYLNVAEMAFAVAIGVDWAGQWLPQDTVKNAREALRKQLLLSLQDKSYLWWLRANDNWNQVCHSGLSVAAIVLADKYPELAARIISRALNDLPYELASYSPNGAYPEGPMYWGYGTAYTLLGASAFKTAFDTDFNITNVPGFMESATYKLETISPSGQSFNYSDSSLNKKLGLYTHGILAWFAQKTGDTLYFNPSATLSRLYKAINDHQIPPRFSPEFLIWISQFKRRQSNTLPVYWKGEGDNPVAIFRAKNGAHTGFYLGAKGGSAAVNHGNMDVGSFVFELNGVRWAIDPGTHEYFGLEQAIGSSNLWDESQNSQRWSLLTKGNKFHSTLTIDGKRHNVDGFAPIESFQVTSSPQSVSFDLSSVLQGQVRSAHRTFKKLSPHTLQIEDDIEPSKKTKQVTWAMMTQADVLTAEHGAVLKQDNKNLYLKIIHPGNMNISVVSLLPPPLPYDKKIAGLKKIEITIPHYMLGKKHEKIVVELTAKNS